MQTVDELTAAFRARGLRVTPQRQAIFRLLQGNAEHPTVESLFEAARREMPTISLRTVYQTVHDLEGMREVELVDVGTGSVRVDPNTAPHHHLVCDGCGMIRDVPMELPALEVPAPLRQGFEVGGVEVVFRGRCERCGSPADPV